MSPKTNDAGGSVPEAVLQVFTAGVGSATALAALGAGPVGTVVGAAAPPAIALTVKLSQRVAEWVRLREGRVVELASTSMGGLDIFEERLQDPERLELYARVIKAAGRSTFEAKLRALARVLEDGLDEDGSVHEAMVLASVLDDLEAPHVLLLQYLGTAPLPHEGLRQPNGTTPRGWELGDLEKAIPGAEGVVSAVVAVLVRHGLVRDIGGVTYPGSVGPAVYRLAPLGERCLYLLGVHAEQPQG